ATGSSAPLAPNPLASRCADDSSGAADCAGNSDDRARPAGADPPSPATQEARLALFLGSAGRGLPRSVLAHLLDTMRPPRAGVGTSRERATVGSASCRHPGIVPARRWGVLARAGVEAAAGAGGGESGLRGGAAGATAPRAGTVGGLGTKAQRSRDGSREPVPA